MPSQIINICRQLQLIIFAWSINRDRKNLNNSSLPKIFSRIAAIEVYYIIYANFVGHNWHKYWLKWFNTLILSKAFSDNNINGL